MAQPRRIFQVPLFCGCDFLFHPSRNVWTILFGPTGACPIARASFQVVSPTIEKSRPACVTVIHGRRWRCCVDPTIITHTQASCPFPNFASIPSAGYNFYNLTTVLTDPTDPTRVAQASSLLHFLGCDS